MKQRRPRHGPIAPFILERSRQMRRGQGDAERRVWYCLRDRRLAGMKFRRQFPIGPFIADFCCVEKKLVIEVDGSQHDCEQNLYDRGRTQFLEANGYTVLRFWNADVLRETDAVADAIAEVLTQGDSKKFR